MAKTVTYVLKSGEKVSLLSDVANSYVDRFLEWCARPDSRQPGKDLSAVVFTTTSGNQTLILLSEVAAVVVE